MMLTANSQSEGYLPRYIDPEIEELFSGLSAIAIDGPKAVGKTETASRHCDTVLTLDSSTTRQAYELNGTEMLTREQRVCIDEWQREPEI